MRGSCSKSLSQKLQKLQNRAALVLTFSNYDRSTDESLRMVNWFKLDCQRLVNKSIMMYKIVNNMVPECLSSRFVFRSDTLTYNLRDSDGTLAIPQPRTNYCKEVCLTAELYCGIVSGFSFEAGGRTFRQVVCHSTSGTLRSLLAIFFFTTVLYIFLTKASHERTD